MKNILETEKKGLYCIKDKGIIDYSHHILDIKRKHGEGNYDATLTAMERNLQAIIKECQERLEIVTKKKAELRQQRFN